MKTFSLTLGDLVERLNERRPFAFSRWGDGEWSAVLGRRGRNCDGQEYTPELREALSAVLRARPGYLLGIQALAVRRFGDEIERWLGREGLAGLRWADAGIFHTASIKEQLGPLVAALQERGVLLVGPRRLAGLANLFQIAAHVEVPPRDAYGSIGQWSGEALKATLRLGARPVIAVSAGMGANVLIQAMHDTLPDRTTIDFGSVWEPYVGVANRTYHAAILRRLAA